MKRVLFPFVSGGAFGAGLLISGGANPDVVQGYLDFFGDWDPRILLMFLGALAVYAPLLRLIARRDKPLFEPRFDRPTQGRVDRRLILGAAVFGVGWGLSGFCPGPGFTTLFTGHVEPLVFVVSMLAGLSLVSAVKRFREEQISAPADPDLHLSARPGTRAAHRVAHR